MGRAAIVSGATSVTVAQNITRIRGGLGLRLLSERITNRVLDHSQLYAVEQGKRRVDVDDLVCIAAALDVSPVTLLMPHCDTGRAQVRTSVQLTALDAQQYWKWLIAARSLGLRSRDSFQLRARPSWAARRLSERVGGAS